MYQEVCHITAHVVTMASVLVALVFSIKGLTSQVINVNAALESSCMSLLHRFCL